MILIITTIVIMTIIMIIVIVIMIMMIIIMITLVILVIMYKVGPALRNPADRCKSEKGRRVPSNKSHTIRPISLLTLSLLTLLDSNFPGNSPWT